MWGLHGTYLKVQVLGGVFTAGCLPDAYPTRELFNDDEWRRQLTRTDLLHAHTTRESSHNSGNHIK